MKEEQRIILLNARKEYQIQMFSNGKWKQFTVFSPNGKKCRLVEQERKKKQKEE